MLLIEPTEHLTGIRITGDYWDIDELLSAINEIMGDEKRYYDYQGARNRILAVCLELKNAIRGERNIEFVSNGIHKGIKHEQQLLAPEKNVYFSTEILLPEIIFTAIALNDFVRLHQELVDNTDWNIHVSIIRHFQALLADRLQELMTQEHYIVFLQMLHAKQPAYFRYATQYVDVLNLEYLALSPEEREESVAAFALRLLMEDDNYNLLKTELIEAASITKSELHELDITLKYPKEIIW